MAKASKGFTEEKEETTEVGGFTFEANLNDLPEIEMLEEGEHELRCAAAEKKTSKPKDGKEPTDYFNVRLESVENPNADDVYYMISLPGPDDSQKDATKKLQKLRKFCDAFGVDYSSGRINIKEAIGNTATCLVGQEEFNGNVKANIKRVITE